MDRPVDNGAARVRRILREMDGGGGNSSRAGSLHLGVFPAPAPPGGTPRCLHCEGALVVHQPDPWYPGRLLGICKACRSWCLMDLNADETRWLVVPLPTSDDVRAVAPDDAP